MKQQAEGIVQAMGATGRKRLIFVSSVGIYGVSDLIVRLALTEGMEIRRSLGVSRGGPS
jgi:hypothetical protein